MIPTRSSAVTSSLVTLSATTNVASMNNTRLLGLPGKETEGFFLLMENRGNLVGGELGSVNAEAGSQQHSTTEVCKTNRQEATTTLVRTTNNTNNTKHEPSSFTVTVAPPTFEMCELTNQTTKHSV